MGDYRPLAGCNIVVTRPRAQAVALIHRIESAGGRAYAFPLLEIEPVKDPAALQARLARLIPQADLVIFVSPNAVGLGMPAIQAAGGLPFGVQVAAVGQGTARALQAQGIAPVLAPQERFDSEGLLALSGLQQVRGRQVLIMRGDRGRELLGDTLKARGAVVEYVTCYLRRRHPVDVAALLAVRPHAVVVTSSEALSHLWEQIRQTPLLEVPLFVSHPRIADLAKQQGWQRVMVTASGDDGILNGLIAWAEKESMQ